MEIVRDFLFTYIAMMVPLYFLVTWFMNVLFDNNILPSRVSLVVEDISIEKR